MRPCSLPGLVKCERCGFVSANLTLTDAEVAALYDRGYFHGDEYLDYVAEEESLRLNFNGRLRTLQQVVPDLRERDIFEIGCAYGFFLDEARHFARSVAGIDISQDATAYGRSRFGLDVQQGDYLSRALGKKYGVIAMWDTVEHLQRPDLFIEKVKDDLQPGGILALTTGDIGSVNARLRGQKWRMIHPPTHLHYFSAGTMKALLGRHGFDVVHLSHPGDLAKTSFDSLLRSGVANAKDEPLQRAEPLAPVRSANQCQYVRYHVCHRTTPLRTGAAGDQYSLITATALGRSPQL